MSADEISYARMTTGDLLDAFASNEPVPGGGSAAALAGALGASLLMMVAGLPKTRTDAPEEAADLAEAAARLRPLRETLVSLVDEDSESYRAVVDAYRLPKSTDADRRARTQAVADALRGATDVPLHTMRACQQALRGAIAVARAGNRNAASDAGAGIELLLAAVRGAGMNVDANISSIKDASYVDRVKMEREELEREALADADRARQQLAI